MQNELCNTFTDGIRDVIYFEGEWTKRGWKSPSALSGGENIILVITWRVLVDKGGRGGRRWFSI